MSEVDISGMTVEIEFPPNNPESVGLVTDKKLAELHLT